MLDPWPPLLGTDRKPDPGWDAVGEVVEGERGEEANDAPWHQLGCLSEVVGVQGRVGELVKAAGKTHHRALAFKAGNSSRGDPDSAKLPKTHHAVFGEQRKGAVPLPAFNADCQGFNDTIPRRGEQVMCGFVSSRPDPCQRLTRCGYPVSAPGCGPIPPDRAKSHRGLTLRVRRLLWGLTRHWERAGGDGREGGESRGAHRGRGRTGPPIL